MKNGILRRLTVSALVLALLTSGMPAMVASAEGYAKDCIFETRESDGKQIWFEKDVQMGVYGAPGNVWYDGTERGKEIYDPASDAWYWLDTVFEGAKATGKEVFMPYVYGDEATFDSQRMHDLAYESNTCAENAENAKLGYQIWQSMQRGTGKWVRYDQDGKMIKGWVTIEGPLAEIYKDQVGNVYYYDQRTGVMAKGIVEIDGKHYSFDRDTGVCRGETQEPTDEEVFLQKQQEGTTEEPADTSDPTAPSDSSDPSETARKALREEYSEMIYEDDADTRTEYVYGDEAHPTVFTEIRSYEKTGDDYVLMGESKYEIFSAPEGAASRQISERSWIREDGVRHLNSVTTWQYPENSTSDTDYSRRENIYYNVDGTTCSSKDILVRTYNEQGQVAREVCDYVYYNGDVEELQKTETAYSYDAKGNLTEMVNTMISNSNITGSYVMNKELDFYDENGNLIKYEYYSYDGDLDPETQRMVGELKQAVSTVYTYGYIGGRWQNTAMQSYEVVDGTVTDRVCDRTEYTYDAKGRETEIKTYRNLGGNMVCTDRIVKTYNQEGLLDTSRSYTRDVDEETGSVSDFYLSDGYDLTYVKVDDPTKADGYRYAEQKETGYGDEDRDGQLEVSYTFLFDTEFNWDTTGLKIGDTKQRVTRYYVGEDRLNYTYTDTYRVIEQ